ACARHRNEGGLGRDLPKAAWKRAVASAPVLSAEGNLLSKESARMVELTPYFAPFDRFLTRFDFIFANRLSAVFATAPYARLPLRSIDGKTI
ncbi:tRNA lysidine(34) synthetase TilS, partial [Rhizobium leguminosarum]